MKPYDLSRVAALAIILSVVGVSTASAQAGMELSKQEFVDMYVNMLEKADEMQAGIDANMREQLGEQQYQQYKADAKQQEAKNEQAMAACLGISNEKFASFKKILGPDFQAKSLRACSGKLPEKVKLVNLDPELNPEIGDFTNCIEKRAADETGIPIETIKQCSRDQGDS